MPRLSGGNRPVPEESEVTKKSNTRDYGTFEDRMLERVERALENRPKRDRWGCIVKEER